MRPAATTAVLGLALAVAAPTTWWLTRPDGSAGAPVEEVSSRPRRPTPAGRAQAPCPRSQPGRPPPPVRSSGPRRCAWRCPPSGFDTLVDPVGVEPDGQMTIPAEVDRVGWYRFGPAPGDAGSAVIAGHVDDREQGLGAMAPLREAEPGDEVAVTDAAGTTTRWRVVSRELIQKQVLPLDRLFAREGPPRLTLITRGGPFLAQFGSYRDNVVVAEPLP